MRERLRESERKQQRLKRERKDDNAREMEKKVRECL